MSHTPGPWERVDRLDPRGQPVPFYRGLVALVSCDPSIAVVADRGRTASASEWDANARLIAAAPELLRVAELAVGVALGRPHDGSQLDEDLEGLLLEARAAIAKARGES